MSNFLQDFDFPSDSFYIFLVVDLVFLKDFDGYLLASKRMLAKLYLSECTLAKMFA